MPNRVFLFDGSVGTVVEPNHDEPTRPVVLRNGERLDLTKSSLRVLDVARG